MELLMRPNRLACTGNQVIHEDIFRLYERPFERLNPRICDLPVVDIRVADGGGSTLPTGIGNQGLLGTIRILNIQLKQQASIVAIPVIFHIRAKFTTIPAVPDSYANLILTQMDLLGNFILLV